VSKTDQQNTRAALITGSGRNIGRAIALELAKRGFNIVLNGSTDQAACESVASEIETLGSRAVIAMGDVGIQEDALNVAQTGLKQFNTIDVLVNNAAIRPSFNLLTDKEVDFQRIMNVNFYSAWWLTRACLPGMINNNWGRVINFTGMNAQQGFTGKSAVSISKHASWGLTKSIAKEYGRNGITANIISPGTIVGDDEIDSANDSYVQLKSQNPSGRLGDPIDIANTVGYLTSEDAGFVNGQLLQVNGGVVV
jgi:3-oxoacyl-[acyl-carrier protein] reductase